MSDILQIVTRVVNDSEQVKNLRRDEIEEVLWRVKQLFDKIVYHLHKGMSLKTVSILDDKDMFLKDNWK